MKIRGENKEKKMGGKINSTGKQQLCFDLAVEQLHTAHRNTFKNCSTCRWQHFERDVCAHVPPKLCSTPAGPSPVVGDNERNMYICVCTSVLRATKKHLITILRNTRASSVVYSCFVLVPLYFREV